MPAPSTGRATCTSCSLADMGFTYRHCGVPDDWILTEALYQGTPGEPAAILREMDEVADYREKNQPIRERTGGSTFKNPPGNSAWKLIDEAGCRGLRVGGAKVSEMHCNFLINDARRHGRGHRAAGRDRARARQGALGHHAAVGDHPLRAAAARLRRRAKRWRRRRSHDRSGRYRESARAHARARRRADGRLVRRARGEPAVGRGRCAALASEGYRVTPLDVGRDLAAKLAEIKPDVCFNALHGRFGEDGCIQGVLECARHPLHALGRARVRARHAQGARQGRHGPGRRARRRRRGGDARARRSSATCWSRPTS